MSPKIVIFAEAKNHYRPSAKNENIFTNLLPSMAARGVNCLKMKELMGLVCFLSAYEVSEKDPKTQTSEARIPAVLKPVLVLSETSHFFIDKNL